MKSGYSDLLTIDRIDNELDYSPYNCKWSTIKEQNVNRRSTILVDYNGEIKPFSYICKEIGIPRQTVMARMKRNMTFEQAINCVKYIN